jgi:hypothetical protein
MSREQVYSGLDGRAANYASFVWDDAGESTISIRPATGHFIEVDLGYLNSHPSTRIILSFDYAPIIGLQASGTIRRYSMNRAPRYIRELIQVSPTLHRIREIAGGSHG